MKKVFDKKTYYDDTFVIQEISPPQRSKKAVSYKKKRKKNYNSITSKMPGYRQHLKKLLILHEQALHTANTQLKASGINASQFLSSQHRTPAELVNIYMADEGAAILNEMFKSVTPQMNWTPDRFIRSAQLALYKVHFNEIIISMNHSPQYIVGTLLESYQKDTRRQSIPAKSAFESTSSKKTNNEKKLPKDNYEPYIPDYSDREFTPREEGRKRVTAEEINKRWADKHPDQVEDWSLPPSDSSPTVQTKKYKSPAVASKKKLYIFTSFSLISCNTQKHKVIETAIPLFSIIEKHYIDVPVHKCLTCKRTFISEEMWRAYMKHGIDKAYYVQHETQFDQFKKHSELNSHGYTVGKTGLSVVERQVLIMDLLKSGKMQAFEIERDIVNAINIHQNNPKMYDAVSDWEDDLKFLGDYTLKNIR